jgi:hypothetical protein
VSGNDWVKVNGQNLVRLRQHQHEGELIQSTITPALRSPEERTAEQELERWVKEYEGANSFVRSLQTRLSAPGFQYLTPNQAATALLVRAEERTGIRKARPKTNTPPKLSASRRRGQQKQMEQRAYDSSKLVIRRTDRTGG